MGLFDLFSNDDAEKAAQMANAGATAGYTDLSKLFDQGRSDLTTNFGNAGDLYKNLITSYAPGSSAYADASGANGAAGLARATTNFKSSPIYGQYGFTLDQGLQALNRTHAAAGNLNSGNADTDTLNYATNLANNTYSSYLSGLSPYLNLTSNATMGAANVDTGLGTALAGIDTAQGNAANNTQTTIGNNNAGAEMNNYKVSGNLWNGIMGAASLAAGGLGGVPGLGSSIGGALTGGFGGNGFSLGPTSVGGAPVKGGLFSAFS